LVCGGSVTIRMKNRRAMTQKENEKRLRFLQRQARELIRHENEAKIQKALVKIRDYYTGSIGKKFDPVLSAKIDCVTWLIEN